MATNSGLRTVDYASGWSNRIDVAVRRAIMTGLSQITAKVNESNANELGTDTYEVSWHSGARPAHQVWQGKWYTHQQLIDVCGLGTVTGLCGANCYHDYYPVIPGISEPTYTAEELKRMNAEENKKTEFRGKEYTKYEALQRQRKLETTMRAQRQKIRLLEEGGADEDDILAAKARYRATSHEYAELSKATGLPQQRQRVYVDGLGTIKSKSIDNSGGSGIIKEKNLFLQGSKGPLTIDLQYFAKIPVEKFTKYALNSIKQPDKAIAFRNALGYTIDNYEKLIANIREHFDETKMVKKDENDYGVLYEYVMSLVGDNGKQANVCTSWIIRKGETEPQLTSAYITKKKVTK